MNMDAFVLETKLTLGKLEIETFVKLLKIIDYCYINLRYCMEYIQ